MLRNADGILAAVSYYAGTLAYAAAVSVWAAWRFQDAVGRAVSPIAVFRHSGLDPGRFLPSFIMPSTHWTSVRLAILAVTLASGYALGRETGTVAPRGTWLPAPGRRPSVSPAWAAQRNGALESAMPPVWREHDYQAEVDWRGGRLPIRVELGRISRQNPARFAYVDAIEIRRLAP